MLKASSVEPITLAHSIAMHSQRLDIDEMLLETKVRVGKLSDIAASEVRMHVGPISTSSAEIIASALDCTNM